MSAYNTTHFGTGIFSNHQSSYIMFNERESPQMALFTIYLQLPMYDFPHMLKGLYLCLDYNRNPIARRIIFIKHSDSTNMDDFLELKGAIIPKEELTEEQIPYYNYTCQPGDYIKTCSVPLLHSTKRIWNGKRRYWQSETAPPQKNNFATWLHSLFPIFALKIKAVWDIIVVHVAVRMTMHRPRTCRKKPASLRNTGEYCSHPSFFSAE